MSNYSVEGDWNKFVFKLVEPADHQKIYDHIVVHLFPCLKCIGYTDAVKDDWLNIFHGLLNDGNKLSFVALDKATGDLAGLRVATIVKKDHPEPPPTFKHKINQDMFNGLDELDAQCGIWEKYPHLDKYADFFGISVDPKYRQQGLCTELYKRAILWSKSRGLSIAKVSFSSPYSRKAGKKHGFRELGRMQCIDFKDEKGLPLNPTVDPLWYIDMGVLEFTKD